MKCDKFINKYIESDNSYSLKIMTHLLFCSSCRNFVREYNKVLDSFIDDYQFDLKKNLSTPVMIEIRRLAQLNIKEEKYFKWVIAGFLILSSRFALTYSDSQIWLNKYFGDSFGLPMNIVMGIAITIYASVFIISHLEDIKKRVHFKS